MAEINRKGHLGLLGKKVDAYQLEDRQWYVPLDQVCKILGLDLNRELQKIARDEAVSGRLVEVRIEDPERKRKRWVACLNLQAFPFWLGVMVDASQVKPEAREKVVRFKRGVADIVWKVFGPTFVSLDIIEILGRVGEEEDQVDKALPRDLLE